MEIHKAKIKREDEKTTLILQVGSDALEIKLTEDKPNEVKSVFNKLLEFLKGGEYNFKLDDSKEDLFHHICKEYIDQLNSELHSVYDELKDYDLLNEIE